MNTSGTSMPRARSMRPSSMPDMPGMRMSVTTASGVSSHKVGSASSARRNRSTL
jgi:hypothetical protein